MDAPVWNEGQPGDGEFLGVVVFIGDEDTGKEVYPFVDRVECYDYEDFVSWRGRSAKISHWLPLPKLPEVKEKLKRCRGCIVCREGYCASKHQALDP